MREEVYSVTFYRYTHWHDYHDLADIDACGVSVVVASSASIRTQPDFHESSFVHLDEAIN